MSTKVLTILEASLKKIGVLSQGESLSSEEANDAIFALNSMVGSWNTQELLVYGRKIEEFTLQAGKQVYTFGNGGDFDTTVPLRVDAVYYRYADNSEYPVEVIDNERWGKITVKNTSSTIPTRIYIDQSYPLRNAYLYPIPSASKTLIFHNYHQIPSFQSLTDIVDMPQGYLRAVIYNLAIELAPDYGKTIPPEISQIASESLANIKRVNMKPKEVPLDPALSTSSGYYNWRSDE